MLAIRTILCPTDYSDRAAPALEVATALARDYSAELVILHVVPPPVQGVDGGQLVELPTGWEEHARARLEAVRPTGADVRVTRRLVVGSDAAEIVRAATEAKADLIVMGTHGRTGLSRLLAGSVAEAVMRAAPCPVLTVRAPFPQAAGQPAPT